MSADIPSKVMYIKNGSGGTWWETAKEKGQLHAGWKANPEAALIDLEVENSAIDEIAYVQVKSAANQGVLNDYMRRFSKVRPRCARMIFAVRSPSGQLRASDTAVHIWTGPKLAQLVVRLGLAEALENMIGG